ncbi:MAG: nickel pincer cofactor biosynthesis protein LarC [Candidatus Nitrosocaldaceae archaeon]
MLMIDCQVCGIAGDMLLCALVDLGADKDKVINGILTVREFSDSKINNIQFRECKRYGMRGLELIVDYKENIEYRRGIEIENAIDRCVNRLDLSNRAKIFAINTIREIIKAEAKIHGEAYNEVHLHEAASIDTLIDIIGCAVALEDLSIFGEKVYSSKIAVGGGLMSFSHGLMQNPGNAILEILKDRFIIVGGAIDRELTTPTGAALLASLAESSLLSYPLMRVSSVGYGAGRNDFEGVANILRIVRGREVKDLVRESIMVLETNIDDVSSEVIGSMIDELFSAGAKDVNIIPAVSKKNRLANIVKVITDKDSLEEIMSILIREGSTLGIRVQEVERYILMRSILSMPVTINGEEFIVRVKVAREGEKIVNIKPEYDDLKLIANRLGLSLSLARALVDKEILSKFKL